eukprot:scaffold124092_cov13-Tisochrysis_lutea.AAC.1
MPRKGSSPWVPAFHHVSQHLQLGISWHRWTTPQPKSACFLTYAPSIGRPKPGPAKLGLFFKLSAGLSFTSKDLCTYT